VTGCADSGEKKMNKTIAALTVLAFAGIAMAQKGGGACREDASKYCAQTSGGKKIAECLLDHQKDISDACYDTLKKRMDAQQSMQACKKDAEQLCKGIKPGDGRVINCLMDRQKELSNECYDALARAKDSKK
jgi:hypothetical protein